MDANIPLKHDKVELLLKSTTNDPLNTTKLEFWNCDLIVHGNYMFVIIDDLDDVNNSFTSTGNIFNLRDIRAYKTYTQ